MKALFIALSILFFSASVHAEDVVETQTNSEFADYLLPQQLNLEVVPEDSPLVQRQAPEFDALAQRAFTAIHQNDFAEGFNLLSELEEVAAKAGYRNLPDYSRSLLDRAVLVPTDDQAQFLVQRAIELSPGVPGIYFQSMTLWERTGIAAAAEAFLAGCGHMFERPISFVFVSSYGIVAFLAAATLALFVVCVSQLVVNSRRLVFAFAHLVPASVRAVVGPFAVLLAMLAPLAGGIFVAIGVWSLLLSRYIRSCRWCGIAAATLIAGWVFALPVIQRVNLNAYQPLSRAVENLLTQTYETAHTTIFAVPTTLHGPMYQYAAGLHYLRANDFNSARGLFRAVALNSHSKNRSLVLAANHALGVLEYRSGNYGRAKEYFSTVEQSGSQEFSLYYNLALTHMALVDTKGHERYYQLAKDIDAAQLMQVEESHQGTASDVLMSTLPTWAFFGELLKPFAGDEALLKSAQLASQKVLQTLFFRPDWQSVAMFALFVGFFGLVHLIRFERRSSRLEVNSHRRSVLWVLVPGGFLAAGDRPMLALTVMTILFSLIIVGLGEPKWGMRGIPSVMLMQSLCLSVAFLFFVACSAMGLINEWRRTRG